MRFLLAFFCFLPTTLVAQDTLCSQLEIDLDGDLLIGAGDILILLGSYGSNLDVDGDMIPDCTDDCVGGYDTCGVCNGPGPQVLAIDTIVISYDSLFVEASGEWQVFELERDTILHLVCENPGCTDPLAINFDPYATEDGSCVYEETDCTVQFMMFDTNGNGWDGTTYTLTNSEGAVLASGSLDDAQFGVAEGSQGYDLFCLPFNGCYTLELTGGSFPGEKEWQIIDYNTGGVLYDQTNNNGYGVFDVNQPGVVCGCTNSNAFNYDADATADDGSCFAPSCLGNADSTSYILNLTHDIFLNWGNNSAIIYDPASGDTILAAGYVNSLYTPDYETSVLDGYFEFCIPNDACLLFLGSGGSESGLPLWSILDFAGNELHAGGLGVYDIGFGASAGNCLSGCTLPAALNYDANASVDDGSCVICDNGQLGLYITLQDDFGSGWSPGNDYHVVSEETGETVLSGTLASGQTTATSINCLDIGCYTFNTGAIFSTEGWAIADNLGNQYAPLTYGPTNGYPIALGGTDVTDCEIAGCTDPTANNYNFSASSDNGTCEFPPANDSYENAETIACDLILTGSLENANGDEYNGTTVLGNGISNSGAIWYEFNADQDYQVTFNTCASADADNGVTDTDVIVFAVGTDGSLTAIATNDDSGIAGCGSGTVGSFNSIVSINAEQGNNYLVRVGHYSSFSSQTGIAIEANCAPIVLGCMDPAYAEFDASANTDDGSCATLNPTCVEPLFDGYSYSVMEIGDQCWFAENLRSTIYRNGDVIPSVTEDGWESATIGFSALYGEGSSTCSENSPEVNACDEAQSLGEYGRLYNWYAVDDGRGLCPSGWHVPTDGEWTELENYIGSQGYDGTEGTALKSTYGWSTGGNGTDNFGFSALPGGRRGSNGEFFDAGDSGFWWSSSPRGGDAWYRALTNTDPVIHRNDVNPRFGFSVRCLRDAD